MSYQSKAIALGAVAVLVFGSVSYASASGQYGVDVEEVLSELQVVLEENPDLSRGVDIDDFIDCLLAREADNTCEFLRDIDYCIGESYTPKQPKGYAEDISSSLQAMRPFPRGSLEGGFWGNEACKGFGELDEPYPSWYYYFVRGDSYIELQWLDDVGEMQGKIVFSPEEEELPVVWEIEDGHTQRVDLSCYIDFDYMEYCGCRNDRSLCTVLDDVIKIILLYGYWRETDESAFETFDKYNFEGWFSDRLMFSYSLFGLLALLDLLIPGDICTSKLLDVLSADGLEKGYWYLSPLLNFTVEPEFWRACESPNYFDNVNLLLEEGSSPALFDSLVIYLNGQEILDQPGAQYLVPHIPLDLSDHIAERRCNYVCRRISGNPSNCDCDDIPAEILEGATSDIGESWREDPLPNCCGYEWEEEDEVWWYIPDHWCGDFVREMIHRYTDLSPKPTANQILWDYFGGIDEDHPGRYRISPHDTNPYTGVNYKWEDLAWVLQPGYAGSQFSESSKGEKHHHQVIFIDWRDRLDTPGECRISYYAIGGCQSETVNAMSWFSLCDGGRLECICEPSEEGDPEYHDCCLRTGRFWGTENCEPDSSDCNLFGRTEPMP